MSSSTPPAHRPPSPYRSRRGGFALLITITLLAFLVLLLVSLASLTRVETQVANNNQSLAQARQNALFALNVALGQLQKYTGPDQRVTATADLQPLATEAAPSPYPTTDPASGVSLNGSASAVRASIDTYWRASRNRRWTGVWKNGNSTSFSTVADSPAKFNPVASLQSWLVSGNETAATFVPSTAPTGLAFNSAATDDTIKGAADADYPAGRPYRILVGKNSTAAAAASDLDRFVTAPQVPIKSSAAPGLGGTSVVIGNYAWWVGDEGVKARANLVDTYAATNTADANRIRLQSAQRPAIEAMTTNGSDGLAATYPANSTDLLKIFLPSQLGYLSPAATFPAELKSRLHDLSVSSRGVLADTRHGGLKRDLTYALSRPTVAAFQTSLKDAYADTAYNPTSGAYHSPFVAETTAYASKFPAIGSDRYFSLTYEGNGTAADAGIFAYGATWEQLWSFYNMGNLVSDTPAGVFTSATQTQARTVSATQQGLYPVIAQGKIFYRLRFDGAGVVLVDIIPIVVLANPYNVTLSGDFFIRFDNYDPKLVFGTPADPANPLPAASASTMPPEFAQPTSPTDLGNCYLGAIKLVARATGIPPGEAQIFTIDPTAVTIITGTSDAHTVSMVNDYDEDACLTYNTGKSLPPGKTHAALYTQGSLPTIEMFIGNDTDYQNRVAYSVTFRASNSGMSNFGFLVNPVADGVQQGGGVWFTYDDGVSPGPQQSPFYQINYRAMIVNSAGYGTPNNHPLHWIHTYVRYGVTGSHAASNPAPNPFLAANHMLPPGSSASAATTRWGLVNNGVGNYFNTPPASIGGPSSSVGLVNLLFDLPGPDQPLTSLGQLQHFNTAGHGQGLSTYNQAKAALAFTTVHQWQVNYPIANSYPHPRVNRDQVFDMRGDFSYNYDGSYLWNDILWDRFYFSSYPRSGAFDFATDKLVNARYRPFRDANDVPLNDPTRFRGLFLAAQNLLSDGAFNVNSTSVEAWKAVFSSLKTVPVGTESIAANLTAPFARTLRQTGKNSDAIDGDSKAGNTVNAWKGFRNLTTAEVNSLAEEMVLQVRRRGPFLSMSGFVNRRLATAGSDTFNLGLGGALQSAIDTVLNKKADIQGGAPFTDLTENKGNNNNRTYLAELAYRMPTRISGFPGYLLQGDVLSSLGPTLAARSDTFTIRTYGDVVNPATGAVTGRAWCEAVVQRTPDYVVSASSPGGNSPDEIPAVASANETFGRRYQVVGFRWLAPEDI